VPNCLICPLRLLILQALADQAFEEGYTSLDQILQKTWDSDPGVAFVPLAWKKSVIGQGIFKLVYSKYWEIWRRTCLVAGLSDQDEIRPYSLRVGAGDRLSGMLAHPPLAPAGTDGLFRLLSGTFAKLHIRSYRQGV
jgi:hypothetical protein